MTCQHVNLCTEMSLPGGKEAQIHGLEEVAAVGV
jgi:hypothetical protein